MLKHFKKLEKGLKKTGGRNNTGKITVRHRGGGHKRKYYKVDFKSIFVYATILFIKYDPNRSSSIAGIQNSEGAYSYILLTTDSKVGDIIYSVKSENVPIKKPAFPTQCSVLSSWPEIYIDVRISKSGKA